MAVLFPLQVVGIPGTSILSSVNSQSSFMNYLLCAGIFLQGRPKKGKKEDKLSDLVDFNKICVITSRKESNMGFDRWVGGKWASPTAVEIY
jgi:hypothetical protein